jgi:tetratricopeptide (TPR) repeat protein
MRFGGALEFFNKAMELDPLFAPAWFNKGFVLGRLQMNEEAAGLYLEVLKVSSPNTAEFHAGLMNLSDTYIAL